MSKVITTILIFLILFFNTKSALSQELKGRVLEINTSLSLDSVKIQVLTDPEATYTDKNGNFKISCRVNDLLILSKVGFITDTFLVVDMKLQQIYLTPKMHVLEEVKVNAINVKSNASFGMFDPDFHNQTIAKQLDENGNYKGGVALRFWYWKKDEKKKKKYERISLADSVYRRIPEVFCRDTIIKYLPLKDGEISGFISKYSPSMEEFMSTGFNLVLYLSECYKQYKKLQLSTSE